MKLQQKLPTSMRYVRVQEILESDPACRKRLSPKTQPVESRFGDQGVYSKEVIEVTEALHAEGKDAHKVPKNDVLRAAMRIMRGSGNHAPPAVSVQPPTPAPVAPPPATELPPAPRAKKKVKAKADLAPPTPPPPPPPVAVPAKKPAKAKKLESKPTPPPKKVKAEAPKATPVETPPSAPTPPPPPPPVPESELPPEKQRLKLPPELDPTKYPHYSVQSSIFSLLLSALTMSEHYEKYPGADARQKKLDDLIRDYQETCDPLKIKA